MRESEMDQDGKTARELRPRAGAGEATPGRSTPRWVWAWILPLVAIVFLYEARTVLGPFIIAGVLAYIFSIVVDRIQDRLNWPRALIVGILYLIVLGALGVGLYFGSEAIYEQTRDFIRLGPNIVERALDQVMHGSAYTFGGQTFDARTLAQRINDGVNAFFGTAGGVQLVREIMGRLLDSILVIIVSFYLLVDGKRLGAYILKFVPAPSRVRTGYVAGRIHTVLGAYLRGQLLLILLMSTVSFLILQFVFNVPYALPLGIITGFFEILPLIGPAIAAVLAAGVAFSAHGAGAALGVIIVYTILRELEDQVVMPFVVGKAVDLHPVVTIFAVLSGGAIAGVLGMLLAVPAAAAIKVILDFLYPTDPDTALDQARPGMEVAQKEAKETGEEPAGAPGT